MGRKINRCIPPTPWPQILLRQVRLLGQPFETRGPPDVQRNVIVSAQIALARRGLYHEDVNGVYGPANGVFAASISSNALSFR